MATIDEILAAEEVAFARAVKAIITGDVPAPQSELVAKPELISARSVSNHHTTLLHYVSANGIESELQRPVSNADEIAAVLLAAGALADAPCDAYEGRCKTTMDLLVSSDHPTEAGIAGKLVELLLSAGAAVDGPDDNGSPLATALLFGTLDCIRTLIACGARTENVVFAAAAGRTDWVRGWLDGGDRSDDFSGSPSVETGAGRPGALLPLSSDRSVAAEQALVFASMCGRLEVVRYLLDRGTNVNASPPGSHWTATALHTAAIQGHVRVVDHLLQRGADPAIKDSRYQSTPRGWSGHARGPRRLFIPLVAKLLSTRSA